MLYDDLYLAHHGVKGQKWGVRKAQYQSDIRSRIKKNKDSKTTLRSEAKNIRSEYRKKQHKTILAELGLGAVLGGAAIAGSIITGGLGTVPLTILYGTAGVGDLIASGVRISNMVDLSRKVSAISELGKEYGHTDSEIFRRRE